MPQERYLFIFGGTIGDGLLGAHLGRLLQANMSNATLFVISTRQNSFVRELLSPLPFIEFQEHPKEKLSSWFWVVSLLRSPWKSVVYEPLSGVPLWWRIILWFASRRGGSSVTRLSVTIDEKRNMFDTPLSVLTTWGVPITAQPAPTLPFSQADCAAVSLPKSPYLIFQFFAGITRRSIPAWRAKEILLAARSAFPTHQLVLTGSAGDKVAAEGIAKETQAQVCVGLHPQELKCMIAGADVFIGVDTGPTHIAAHLQAPMVVLGHNNAPFWWTPPYTPYSIVLRANRRCLCLKGKTEECFDHAPEGRVYRCLIDIEPSTIVEAIKKLMHE